MPHPDPQDDRDTGRMDRRGGEAADHHHGERRERRWRRSAASPSDTRFRWSRSGSAWSACRPAIRCTWATTRRACSQEADLVIVMDADVPWIPNEQQSPRPTAASSSIGEDPAFMRYPMRSFPSDLAITSNTASALEVLEQALAKQSIPQARIDARRTALTEFNSKRKRGARQGVAPRRPTRSRQAYLSRMIGEVVGDDAVIFNEYSLMQDHCPREKAGHVLRPLRRRRAWLGLRRGARRQARGAREAGGRDARRRRLHVRQSDGRRIGCRTCTSCRS